MCNSVLYLFSRIYIVFLKVQPAREDIEGFHGTDAQASCIAKVLSASQKYMRQEEVNAISSLII